MRKQPLIVLFVFLVLAILIFVNNNSGPVSLFSAGIESILDAPRTFLYSFKTGGEADNTQIKKLKEENASLAQKLIEYDRTKRDNEALRSQFETAQTPQYKLLPSRVIGFLGNFSSPNALVIDRGLKNGVREGMAVIFKNDLVGKIEKVSQVYSRVLLPNNTDFVTVAKTSDGLVQGIVRGNDDFILLDRVSINDSLSADSTVLTAGSVDTTGIGIPPGLVIGKITSVNHSPSLPFQTAKVESRISFGRLGIVYVVAGLK